MSGTKAKEKEKEVVVEIFHCHQAENCPYYLCYKELDKMIKERLSGLEASVQGFEARMRWIKWLVIIAILLMILAALLGRTIPVGELFNLLR